ncbi:hypothetical protein BJY24_000416 [Nocardia transvalensis]|uniref:Uncharacterized protein n=1 Tax=Nocardia transvalensis TaxID=37333 RepID=A0A7W9P9D0_9NOCA|nr:hypothetical protein [Nocardia transvalensis]MBB5911549.1 hypothetical protein [Nocardia transvalensis]
MRDDLPGGAYDLPGNIQKGMPVALMVFYSRVREDRTEVEYRFGTSEDSLDRSLTIDKEALEVRDPERIADGLVRETAGSILQRHGQQGRWPEKGLVQT